MRQIIAALLCAALFPSVAASAAPPSVHDRLTTLAKTMVFTMARRHPMQATALGISGYDAKLSAPSKAYRARDLALLRDWEGELAQIAPPQAHLSLVDRDDATLLGAQLRQQIDALTVYRAAEKDYAGAANGLVGTIFTQFQNLPIPGRDGATASDLRSAWLAIVSRLAGGPAYIEASQALVDHPGHLQGVTGSEQLAGVPSFFNGPLTAAAKAQLSASDFARFVAARDATLHTIAQTKAYVDAHDANWPENFAMGRAAYDRMLHRELLLPYDAIDVERFAQAGLAHGWAVEAWLTQLARLRHTPFGPATGGGLAPGGAALIPYYRERIAQLRAFVQSHHVITIPHWLGSVQVVETPSFLQPVSPGASMNPPLLFSKSSNGYYFITPPTSLEAAAKRLSMNQDFDRDRILSTAAHEVMPGHFLQLSIAKRNPDFIRRIQSSGVFAEGWAFYGEEMFVQLGLYGDDLDGRLYTARWERVRGARAMVDPKLATGEWTYRQAADYFARETGFTKAAADAEVAAIALGPGYFISYIVGRQQLETLLGEYMLKMGSKGSLLDFHDRLMCYGTTPYAIVGPELLADLKKPLAEVRAAARY